MNTIIDYVKQNATDFAAVGVVLLLPVIAIAFVGGLHWLYKLAATFCLGL